MKQVILNPYLREVAVRPTVKNPAIKVVIGADEAGIYSPKALLYPDEFTDEEINEKVQSFLEMKKPCPVCERYKREVTGTVSDSPLITPPNQAYSCLKCNSPQSFIKNHWLGMAALVAVVAGLIYINRSWLLKKKKKFDAIMRSPSSSRKSDVTSELESLKLASTYLDEINDDGMAIIASDNSKEANKVVSHFKEKGYKVEWEFNSKRRIGEYTAPRGEDFIAIYVSQPIEKFASTKRRIGEYSAPRWGDTSVANTTSHPLLTALDADTITGKEINAKEFGETPKTIEWSSYEPMMVSMESDDYDPKQIKMGEKVEMEHIGTLHDIQKGKLVEDKNMVREISQDHLNEISDYYTRLQKMENQKK